VSLLATCRSINAEVSAYMRRAFSINRILEPYFQSPDAFRILQSQTDTLISGSAALQFFDRSFYPESDLDLYVDLSYAKAVVTFLKQDGYSFRPSAHQYASPEDVLTLIANEEHFEYYGGSQTSEDPSQTSEDPSNVSGVLTFSKGEREVQVVTSRSRSPLSLILEFHSSERCNHCCLTSYSS
jgi:hypothetical protein